MKTFILTLVYVLAGAVYDVQAYCIHDDTLVDNQCIICPNGAINDYGGDAYAPFADFGDNRTCGDLIEAGKQVNTWSEDCGWEAEFHCCRAVPENRYSRSSPFVPRTELAMSQNQVMGSRRRDICSGVTVKVGLAKSIHDNIASCMMLLVVDRVMYFRGGRSSSSSWEM